MMHLQTDGIGSDQLAAEDAEILRAQAGDAEAFTPLMNRHRAEVMGVALRHAPVAHLAEDLTCDTFVFAWQNLGRFRVGTDFGAWLRSIAWQLARARREREQCRLRQLERYAEHCRCEEEQTPSLPLETERARDILTALTRLPAERRQLVLLCDYEGCTSTEAAARLGRTSTWVRTTLHRARHELRSALSSHSTSNSQS